MKGNHLSIVDILSRRWPTFLLTGSVLSLLFAVGYGFQPQRRESFGIYRPKTTELRGIDKPKKADLLKQLDFLDKTLNQVFLRNSSVTAEARLIKDDDNLQSVIETLEILDHEGNLASPRSLRKRITLSSTDGGETVRIGLHDPDPEQAQKIINQLMQSYVERFATKSESQTINFQSLIQPQLVQSETIIKQSQQALYQIQLGANPTPLAPREKAGDQTLDLQSIRVSVQQQLSTSANEMAMLQRELNTSVSDRKILLQEIIALSRVRQDVLNILLTTLDQPRDSVQIPSLLDTLERKTLELKKNLTVSETIYGNFLQEQTSNWVINSNEASQVAVLSDALTPQEGYRPYKKWFLGIGLLTSLVGGTVASWLTERKDTSFRSLADIYAYTQLPIFGLVPHYSHKQRRFQQITREDGGNYPDALTALTSAERILANFELASLGRIPQVLALTSTLRQEGTSLTTANLAYALTIKSKKVLIIDANLYYPQQHELWHRPQSLGLCDCMAGEAQLGKTLQRLHPNLDLLQAGYTHKNKDILLNSPAISILIKDFRSRYDHILIDTPSFEVSVHGYLLANSADATVLLVHPNRINFEQVSQLKETAQRTEKKLWGMIINDSPQNPTSSKTLKLIQNSQWDANLRLQQQTTSSQSEISTLSAINPRRTDDESIEGEAAVDLERREQQEDYLYHLPIEELHKLVNALLDSWSSDIELLLEQEEELVQQSRSVRELQETIEEGSAYLKLSSEMALKEEKEKLDLLAEAFMGQRRRMMEIKEDLTLYQEVLLARTDAELIPTRIPNNPMEFIG